MPPRPIRRAKPLPGAESAYQHLIDFAPHIYPPYQAAAHLIELCDLIMQVLSGDIDRAIISMPPRHGKTLTTSKITPTWYLGHNPAHTIMLISYTLSLARDNSRAVRTFVQSPAFQEVFPDVRLSPDSQAAEQWMLEGQIDPAVIAAGVGGPITGKGAHLMLVDDPYKNYAQARSITYNNTLQHWWQHVARTRLEPDGKIIIIMTRWTENDFADWLLTEAKRDPRADQWETFTLPAISSNGEALWPERYPIEALERIRASIGPKAFSAEYQGQPVPAEGGLFKREHVRIIDNPPLYPTEIGRFWDTAATSAEKATAQTSQTAGGRMSIVYGDSPDEDHFYLEDMVAGLWGPGEVDERIIEIAKQDGPGVRVYIEQEPGSAGLHFISSIHRQLPGYKVAPIPLSGMGDKETRAVPVATEMRRGHFFLVRGIWNEAFIKEALSFPEGRKDQIDAISLGHMRLHREGPGMIEAVRYA